jgi:RNA recognition motif-containing protein
MANRRHRLFLRSGIGPNLTEDVLRGFYQRFGPVVDVYIPKDPVTRQPKGFAFVSFSEELPLNRAVRGPFYQCLCSVFIHIEGWKCALSRWLPAAS